MFQVYSNGFSKIVVTCHVGSSIPMISFFFLSHKFNLPFDTFLKKKEHSLFSMFHHTIDNSTKLLRAINYFECETGSACQCLTKAELFHNIDNSKRFPIRPSHDLCYYIKKCQKHSLNQKPNTPNRKRIMYSF